MTTRETKTYFGGEVTIVKDDALTFMDDKFHGTIATARETAPKTWTVYCDREKDGRLSVETVDSLSFMDYGVSSIEDYLIANYSLYIRGRLARLIREGMLDK